MAEETKKPAHATLGDNIFNTNVAKPGVPTPGGKPWGYNDPSDEQANKDHHLIEFYHIPTDNSVIFKAFVNDFSDKFESDWESEDVFGRMDPIKSFKGTKREISISWEVVAASSEEAEDNLARATLLFSMLYPVYNTSAGASNSTTPAGGGTGATSMSAAPLFKMRFVNLVQSVTSPGEPGTSVPAKTGGLVGTISGFSYSPDFDSGFFKKGQGTVFPQMIKLECTYTAMHTHALGWNSQGEKRQKNFPYNAANAAGTGDNAPKTDTETPPATSGLPTSPNQRATEGAEKRMLTPSERLA